MNDPLPLEPALYGAGDVLEVLRTEKNDVNTDSDNRSFMLRIRKNSVTLAAIVSAMRAVTA